MINLKRIELLNRINISIKQESTGTPLRVCFKIKY